MDQAKKIIGKTLELEFKLPNKQEPTAESIQARKTLAKTVLNQVLAQEDKMQEMTSERGSENIFYNSYSGATLAELPQIYQENVAVLESLEINKVYPGLMEGVYTVMSTQNPEDPTEMTELKGYTFFRVTDKKIIDRTTMSTQDLLALAKQYNLSNEFQSRKNPGIAQGAYNYDSAKNELVYVATMAADGQEAFKLAIYQLDRPNTI